MEYLGNKEILDNHKTAFLCSRQYPSSIVLKAYDWAIKQREKGNCVISGFHSQIEKDVLHYLLKGEQPVILALARGLKKREDNKEIVKALDEGRLLMVSPFDRDVTRITEKTALTRNEFVAELADRLLIAHATKGGKIDNLIKKYNNKKKIHTL